MSQKAASARRALLSWAGDEGSSTDVAQVDSGFPIANGPTERPVKVIWCD